MLAAGKRKEPSSVEHGAIVLAFSPFPHLAAIKRNGQTSELPVTTKSRHLAWTGTRCRDTVQRPSRLLGRKLLLQVVRFRAQIARNDSGIYYCAATSLGDPRPGAQHVGLGTTLVVKEKTQLMVGHVLLWLTFVVLALYSSAIVTLIIQKKYGLNICNCTKSHKNNKQNTNKTRIFRDVLQEMDHRRDVKRSKQTAKRDPAPAEVTSAEFNTPDDIYQNV
ncbi:immunoglobulin superfamily member 6-like isoform X5 [Festucalex cinctus]